MTKIKDIIDQSGVTCEFLAKKWGKSPAWVRSMKSGRIKCPKEYEEQLKNLVISIRIIFGK